MKNVRRLAGLLGESAPAGGSLTEDMDTIEELGPPPKRGDSLTEEVWVPKPTTRATGDVAGSVSMVLTSALASWTKKILDGLAGGREYKGKFDPPKNIGWWWIEMAFEGWTIDGRESSGNVGLEVNAFRESGPCAVGYGEDSRPSAGELYLSYSDDEGMNVSKRWKFDRDATPESVVEAVGGFLM